MYTEDGYCVKALEKYNVKDNCYKDFCTCVKESFKESKKAQIVGKIKFYNKCKKLLNKCKHVESTYTIIHSKALLYPTTKKVKSRISGKLVYLSNRKQFYNFCKKLIENYGPK